MCVWNSVINNDIDLFTDDGSTRFADIYTTATIVNGHEYNGLLGDAKHLFVPGDMWASKAALVSNVKYMHYYINLLLF